MRKVRRCDDAQRLGVRLQVVYRITPAHAVVVRSLAQKLPDRFVVDTPVLLQQGGKYIVAVPHAFVRVICSVLDDTDALVVLVVQPIHFQSVL